MKHTPRPWVIDDGMVRIGDQASMLIADEGTDREWVAIGIEDEDGFAEVVALAHPLNAHLIASGPELLKACKCALADLEGIMPEYEPDGDRAHPAWRTIEELKRAIAKAEGGGA